MVGLLVHSRKLAAQADQSDEPQPLHVYARIPCPVEPALIDKLVLAEDSVRERLPESDRGDALAEVKSQFDEAIAQRAAGKLTESFRAHCRVMHALVRRFNRLRHKEESFNPVWDKHG
jgi:hypothetical protein